MAYLKGLKTFLLPSPDSTGPHCRTERKGKTWMWRPDQHVRSNSRPTKKKKPPTSVLFVFISLDFVMQQTGTFMEGVSCWPWHVWHGCSFGLLCLVKRCLSPAATSLLCSCFAPHAASPALLMACPEHHGVIPVSVSTEEHLLVKPCYSNLAVNLRYYWDQEATNFIFLVGLHLYYPESLRNISKLCYFPPYSLFQFVHVGTGRLDSTVTLPTPKTEHLLLYSCILFLILTNYLHDNLCSCLMKD